MFMQKIKEEKNKRRGITLRMVILVSLVISVIFGAIMTSKYKKAEAFSFCTPCILCIPGDTLIAVWILDNLQDFWDGIIEDDIEELLNKEENFIVKDFFSDFWLKALAELTEFLDAFGMYQVQMVGAFFDAKNQLETSRLFFKLQAEAHRDYHPSDDFCWFGTNSRSLASSESKARLNLLALSQRALERQLGYKDNSASISVASDKDARWRQFVDTYCDPKDNGWESYGTGLHLACDRDGPGGSMLLGAVNKARVNKDIDYTRLIEIPRTLDVDFTYEPPGFGPVMPPALSDDEEDVLSLSSNLYANRVPSRKLTYRVLDKYPAARSLYTELRSIVAKRDVALNSFNSIVAMKSAGSSDAVNNGATGSYIGAVMKDLMPSATDAEIFEIIGESPSYYAQLEILGKKIYQNPAFYANLYDSPANVERKSVAMKAIGLMIDRALFESEIRQEMILSVMLSSALNKRYKSVNKKMAEGENK